MKELIEIQSRLSAPKDKHNDFGNYNYRSAEMILESVKPLLKEQGCTITITDDIILIGDRYYVKATATIKNSSGEIETSSAFAREANAKKGMDESQITGSASSYARKYALGGLLAIDDTKDADATNTNGANTGEVDKGAAIQVVSEAKTQSELEGIWELYAMTLGNDNDFRMAYMKRQQAIANGTKK